MKSFTIGLCFTLMVVLAYETHSTATARAEPNTADGSFSTPAQGNTAIQSFGKAKKILEREIYPGHRITFYCGCPFSRDKAVLPCPGYTPKKPGTRSRRIEWEHIVPAENFGRSFKAWRDGAPECVDSKGKPFRGRNCARKTSVAFRYMEADLYNLVPAIGEINMRRSNYGFDMIPGEARDFGECDMEISGRKAEPPEPARGAIARTYLYMNRAYPGRGIIGKKTGKLFEAWNRQYPVSAWECERARKIESIQGNENPFVKEPCRTAGLW